MNATAGLLDVAGVSGSGNHTESLLVFVASFVWVSECHAKNRVFRDVKFSFQMVQNTGMLSLMECLLCCCCFLFQSQSHVRVSFRLKTSTETEFLKAAARPCLKAAASHFLY